MIPSMIGSYVTISASSNAALVGLAGTVLNETRNMLIIQTASGSKMLPKDINTWQVKYKGEVESIKGTDIKRRFHERLDVP